MVRLQYDGRGSAPRAIQRHHRLIENVEEGELIVSARQQIDAAAPPAHGRRVVFYPDDDRAIGAVLQRDGRAAHGPVEPVAHGEQGVTHHFGVQTPQALAPEELVGRIDLEGASNLGCVRRSRGLPIGCGGHD